MARAVVVIILLLVVAWLIGGLLRSGRERRNGDAEVTELATKIAKIHQEPQAV